MTKRKLKSALPTLPKCEIVNGWTLSLGGKHKYKWVKKGADGYQGCDTTAKLSTARYKTGKEAALALAKKRFDAKTGSGKKKGASPRPARPLHLTSRTTPGLHR